MEDRSFEQEIKSLKDKEWSECRAMFLEEELGLEEFLKKGGLLMMISNVWLVFLTKSCKLEWINEIRFCHGEDLRLIVASIIESSSISKADFTKNIEDTDVGKKIDIEFDPNNLTNTSMSVDGLKTSEILTCLILIIVGLCLLGLGLYLKFSK